jgi:hypothetical protein
VRRLPASFRRGRPGTPRAGNGRSPGGPARPVRLGSAGVGLLLPARLVGGRRRAARSARLIASNGRRRRVCRIEVGDSLRQGRGGMKKLPLCRWARPFQQRRHEAAIPRSGGPGTRIVQIRGRPGAPNLPKPAATRLALPEACRAAGRRGLRERDALGLHGDALVRTRAANEGAELDLDRRGLDTQRLVD